MLVEIKAEAFIKILNTAKHAEDSPLHFQGWMDGDVPSMQGDLLVNCQVLDRPYQVHIVTDIPVVNMDEPFHFTAVAADILDALTAMEVTLEQDITLSLDAADDNEMVITINDSEDGVLGEFQSGDLLRMADFPDVCEKFGVRTNGTKTVFFKSTLRPDFGFIAQVFEEPSMWEIENLQAFLESRQEIDKTLKKEVYMSRARRSQQQSTPVADKSPLGMSDEDNTGKDEVPEADVVTPEPEGAPEGGQEPSEPETPPETQTSPDKPEKGSDDTAKPEPEKKPARPKRRSKEQKHADDIAEAIVLLETDGYEVNPPVDGEERTFESDMLQVRDLLDQATKTMNYMLEEGVPDAELTDEEVEEIRKEIKAEIVEKLMG